MIIKLNIYKLTIVKCITTKCFSYITVILIKHLQHLNKKSIEEKIYRW